MTIFLTILAIVLMLAAVVAAFAGRAAVAAVASWLSLGAAYYAAGAEVSWRALAFWGVAVLMVIGIAFLDRWKRPELAPNAYINGGALAGAVVGMILSAAGIVLGAIIGAIFGALAYSRTPSGSSKPFPTPRFGRQLMQLGLPAAVVMGMLGHALAVLIG